MGLIHYIFDEEVRSAERGEFKDEHFPCFLSQKFADKWDFMTEGSKAEVGYPKASSNDLTVFHETSILLPCVVFKIIYNFSIGVLKLCFECFLIKERSKAIAMI